MSTTTPAPTVEPTVGNLDAQQPGSCRVAILTEQPPSNASTRYRALQYVEHLRGRLGQVDVFTPLEDPPRHSGHVGQGVFFGRHAARYLRRWWELAAVIDDYEAVLVQRGVYGLGPAYVTRPLRAFRGRLVLDLDDAVFLPRPSLERRGRAARWIYGPHQARMLAARADALVVSSPEIAVSIGAGAGVSTVLPSVPDPARYRTLQHRERSPIVIGWTGTPGNLAYLDPLTDVFHRLRAEGVAELEVVSSRPWLGPATFEPWRLEREADAFLRHDVALMPLPDTPYTRAKAGFKLLQAMAAGVPVIASPVGMNVDLVTRSGGGLLATSPRQWYEAVRQLAADAGLRSRMGQEGRRFIERYADIAGHADRLASLLCPNYRPPVLARREESS